MYYGHMGYIARFGNIWKRETKALRLERNLVTTIVFVNDSMDEVRRDQ